MAPKRQLQSAEKKAYQPTVQCHAWCFTINNYTEQDEEDVKALQQFASYVVCGKETAPTTGTPHLQGYVYMINKASFKAMKRALPRARLVVSKGSDFDNFGYSKKEDLWFKFGTPPCQGRRTDLAAAYEIVKETSRMKDVVAAMPNYQAIRCAETYLKYHEAPRDWKPEVRWYFGATGEGKTRLAREWLGECYTCLDSSKFWEGYDAHESVLIDDFRKDFCKFHVLLRILDRYEFRVEVKGASRQLRAKKIAITCPFHPRDVYELREDVGQLLRRIDAIYEVRAGEAAAVDP